MAESSHRHLGRALVLMVASALALVIGSATAAGERSAARPLGRGVAYAQVDHYPSAVALYPPTHTIYAANNGTNDISAVDADRCGAADISGCGRTPPRQDVGEIPSSLAIDASTGTIYVANQPNDGRGSISVVSAARCNSRRNSGCTHYPRLPPTVRLPFNPSDVAIDPLTHTVYAGSEGTGLAVIDTRRCNAARHDGCRRRPYIADIAARARGLAVDPARHTLYTVDYFSGLVTVLDTRQCRAGDTRGCDRPASTVRVGRHPWEPTLDGHTGTLYVTNFGERTVSVIDVRRCFGAVRSGCRRRPGRLDVGYEPQTVAVDDVDHLGFVTDAGARSVSIFDTSRCSAAVMSGCRQRVTSRTVGPLPNGILYDPANGTIYVADNAGHELAVFRARVTGTPGG